MSAWKKPSRMACLRKERITLRPIALRSRPAASMASVSVSGMPSIQSKVITRLAVRSQSTFGTRKSRSPLLRCFPPFPRSPPPQAAGPSPAAPIARAYRPPRPAGACAIRGEAFRHARREIEAFQIALEPPLDAGPQNLDRDRVRAVLRCTHALCTWAMEAAATAGPNLAIDLGPRLTERGFDFRFGLLRRKRRKPVA